MVPEADLESNGPEQVSAFFLTGAVNLVPRHALEIVYGRWRYPAATHCIGPGVQRGRAPGPLHIHKQGCGVGYEQRGQGSVPPCSSHPAPRSRFLVYDTVSTRARSGRAPAQELVVNRTAPQAARRSRPAVSRRIHAIPASGIRKFFDVAASMEDVISLGIGEPDLDTPEHVSAAAMRSIEAGATHYTSNFGLLALREAVRGLLLRRYGLDYDPETELLITTGVSEGLNIAFQALLDPGDEVLLPEPYYVAYPPNIVLAGGTVVTVPTTEANEFRVQVADLERAVTAKTKALMLGYPSNPTGAILTHADLCEIAVFVQRHDLYVVADEIYDRLTYGSEHISFASLPNMRDRTVLLNGFSKAYAMTGWRLGWAAAPADMLDAMMKVHQYVMMSAPTAAQFAGLEAITASEEDVRLMVAEYDRRRRVMVDGFNRIGLACFEPRGAFYCFPNITSTGLTDEEFSDQLLREERVAVIPGSGFGQSGAGHVRACYATSMEQIEKALRRIERFVTRVRAGAA
ncbi:MAG: aminotransferase class I/II-fold pyridoxal phosphate-dependent enzyme [Chloroflexi bacterium]|nr:aminotransferase class I/II-fold pyridoxal phosphate-dependent enzyme [Chloroflexota bacterium]